MCHFLSFAIEVKTGKIRCGTSLDSHSGISDGWNLEPGSYREAEWTGEGPKFLKVRTEDDDYDENWYKSAVLCKYRTRSELLKDIKQGRGRNGGKAYFRNGKLHRTNGPARIWADGAKEYWVDGKLHRTDGPAVICHDGSKAYYVDGKRHRTNGPAKIWADGSKAYWVDGKRHRTNGPAIIWADGSKAYWVDGKLHKTNGPAVIYANGYKEYWVDGKYLTEGEFEKCSKN